MAKVFFTSDLHLGHKNLDEGLRHLSVEECDQLIIDNWNKVVSKKDIVYVLGDITMERANSLEGYLKQLNGTIYVAGGNHDTRKCCKKLQELGITVMGTLEYKGFICTHIPIHPTQLENCRGNIHGHIHVSGEIKGLGRYNPKAIKGRYYNVNTEFHNYTPVLFDDIVKYFEELEKEPKELNQQNDYEDIFIKDLYQQTKEKFIDLKRDLNKLGLLLGIDII